LIEDDPDDAELVTSLLEEVGCGENLVHEKLLMLGLRCLESQEFDLVLLDLSLPDSWGIETLRRLRKSFPHLPVVLMTGATMAEIAEEASSEGAAACLFKQDLDANRLAEILSQIDA
jgi:CheY-like chemotaxis protein